MPKSYHPMQELFFFRSASDQHQEKFKVVIEDNIQSLEKKIFGIEMKFLHGELLSKTTTSNWGKRPLNIGN